MNGPPSLSRSFDANHFERVQLAVLLTDRDIFSGRKGMAAKPIARFIVVRSGRIVIEHPAGMLRAARLVNQEADLIVLATPEAPYATMITMRMPQLCINVPLGIERRHELIAMPRRPVGEFFRAGEIEPDALEIVR